MEDLRTLAALYINDDGVVTCNLGCEDHEFLSALPGRRHTLAAFLDALAAHWYRHHRELGPLLGYEWSHLGEDRGQYPQQESQRHEIHPGGNAGCGQQEAQRRADQQNQHDSRHVDPLSLRARFKT